MVIPTKAELNGRALYVVISADTDDGEICVMAVTTDPGEALETVRGSNGGVAVQGVIFEDIREEQE